MSLSLNPLNWFSTAVDSVSTGVNKVVQTFSGSQKERDSQKAQGYSAGMKQYGAEFRENRNILDSIIDAYNRLPRPFIVTIVICYFVLSYAAPIEFQKINVGLDTVPEKMWYVLSAIIGFYFCARELHKQREGKMAMSDTKFKEVQKRLSHLNSLQSIPEEETEDEYLK